MFNSLTDGLTCALNKIFGAPKLTEANLAAALEEIRAALLAADVHYKVAKEIVEKVREECVGQKVIEGVSPAQQVVKLMNDELAKVLGGVEVPLPAERPLKIILCGLQGSGKTTTAGKLAAFFKKQGQTVTLVACDLQRPAAIDQLEILAGQAGVNFFKLPGAKTPTEVAMAAMGSEPFDASLSLLTQGLRPVHQAGGNKKAESNLQGGQGGEAPSNNFPSMRRGLGGGSSSVHIFDTAGRLQIDTELMQQLTDLQKNIHAQEKWLVIDAALGQQSVAVAEGFNHAMKAAGGTALSGNESAGLSGLILAKLDGDARGGAALAIRSLTGLPIRYTGVGEKLEDLETFYPQRMAGRILGMGDVVSLVEHAQEKIDVGEAQAMAQRAIAADFSLEDLLKQFQQMKKMGDMGKLMQMIPGMGNVSVGSEEQKKMRRSEAIILSMTPKERRNPTLVAGSRLLRIAKGAGVPLKDVNALLKQFNQMRDMMKLMKGGKGRAMMRKID